MIEEENEGMPFVATTDHVGGTYDPASYRAGWELGEIAGMLSMGAQSMSLYIRAENLAQADLLAMSREYLLVAHEHRGGLVSVEIYKAAPDLLL